MLSLMTTDTARQGHLRIGELSRRTGVSVELLRAWERRYGLLSPSRTAGGFRLYGDADERRIRRMLGHLDAGVSAGEAARLALEEAALDGSTGSDGTRLEERARALRTALDEFDEQAVHAVVDRALAEFTLDTVIRDVVVPYLHELGERWATGEASIAQEHFASALLRGRLLGLARGWGSGVGPRALLACVRGEEHDLGLLCFGLALRARGWRITYLGTDTPTSSLADAASLVRPELVVVNVVNAAVSSETRLELEALARDHRLAVGGSGADESLAQSLGAELLRGDPVSAADAVAQR
jgi:DNA-binding transcriptional MerR regulator